MAASSAAMAEEVWLPAGARRVAGLPVGPLQELQEELAAAMAHAPEGSGVWL